LPSCGIAIKARLAQVRKDLATAQTKAAEEMPGQVGTQIADKLKEHLGELLRLPRGSHQSTLRSDDTLRNDLTLAQTDRANLARDLSALRDQHTQDRNRWEAEIQVRDLQIDDLTKRADSLQAAITDKDGKLTNAHGTITALQEELQAAHTDLETTQADMGKLADRVLYSKGR
jgi:chromosome segregation ATPase